MSYSVSNVTGVSSYSSIFIRVRWRQKSSNFSNKRQLCGKINNIILLFNLSLHCPLRKAGNISVFKIYMRNPDRSQVWQSQHFNVTMAVTCRVLSIGTWEAGGGPQGLIAPWDPYLQWNIHVATNSNRCSDD